jgi:DNA-binding LacI/PurR family transcriptional regulator
MNITAKEIAEILQVSPSAVSLALNGKPGISEETRKRIVDKATELGYRTVIGQSQTKLPPSVRFVVYIDGKNVVKEISFHSIVLRGIEAKAKELGYNVQVHYFDQRNSGVEQIVALAQDVEGVLLLGTEFQGYDESCAAILNTIKCPVVVIDNNLFRNDVDCIVTDNTYGAFQAVEYLWTWGHKRIGYFSSKDLIPNFTERNTGVHMAVQSHPDVALERIPVSFATEKAYRDICEWLKDKKDIPTGFFADSDVIAFGAMQAFAHFGYRIPTDVSIVGFDDMPACEMVSPPLTSIRVMKSQTGAAAMQRLHERIICARAKAPDPIHMHITISTKLKERNSVAVPRKEE